MGRPKTILVRRSETIRSSSSRKDYQESWWSHYIGGCWIFPAGLIAVIAIIALLVHSSEGKTDIAGSSGPEWARSQNHLVSIGDAATPGGGAILGVNLGGIIVGGLFQGTDVPFEWQEAGTGESVRTAVSIDKVCVNEVPASSGKAGTVQFDWNGFQLEDNPQANPNELIRDARTVRFNLTRDQLQREPVLTDKRC